MKVKHIILPWILFAGITLILNIAGLIPKGPFWLVLIPSWGVASVSLLIYGISRRAENLWNEVKEMQIMEAIRALSSNLDKALDTLSKERDRTSLRLFDLTKRLSFYKISLPLIVRVKIYNYCKKKERLMEEMDLSMISPIDKNRIRDHIKAMEELELYIMDLSNILLSDSKICQLLKEAEEKSKEIDKFNFEDFRDELKMAENELRKVEKSSTFSLSQQNQVCLR